MQQVWNDILSGKPFGVKESIQLPADRDGSNEPDVRIQEYITNATPVLLSWNWHADLKFYYRIQSFDVPEKDCFQKHRETEENAGNQIS